MLSENAFKEGMKELILAFNLDFSQEQMLIWYKCTKTLSDNQFKSKIRNCILTCRHKPYISDVMNAEDIQTGWGGTNFNEYD